MRNAPIQAVATAIRLGGLANIKAPRIQDALLTLTEEQQTQGGTKSLAEYLYDELMKRTSEEGWSYACYLLYAYPTIGQSVVTYTS